MKITDLRILGRAVPNLTFVEIQSDDGLVGIGLSESLSAAVMPIIEDGTAGLRNIILGQDPRDIGLLWRRMWQKLGCQSGPAVNAMGAVDMALWDLAGKAQGMPIYKLLGGAAQQRVMPYASVSAYDEIEYFARGTLRHKPLEELVAESKAYVQQGFRAVKFGWGNSFTRKDQEELAAIREAIGPQTRLMLDFGNCGYWTPGWNVKAAIRVAKICEEYDVFFLEEPMQPLDVDGHAALTRAAKINIASGEMLCTTHEFKPFIDRHAVDIIQPDASRIGISQFVEVTRMAEKAGILCVPHGPWSLLAVASHLNVLATVESGVMTEYPGASIYERDGRIVNQPVYIATHEIVDEPPRLEDGFLQLPDSPGLGVGGFVGDAIARMEALSLEKGGQ